ncbi:transport and golgi organization 6 isoform X2 [Lasioglossum baleicum]|uniref:transport and golgi organization 6 isoform X2 n=1 Tax=Lasioglossum baleicum TaxID=434251 RepID=UPI003FCCFA89
MMRKSMDYYEILNCLITVGKISNEIENFDDRLQRILQKTLSNLINVDEQFMTEDNESENESPDIRYQYIRTIVYTLQNLRTPVRANATSVFTVEQFRDVKVAIELVTAMGIIPGLLPGVGLDMAKLCPRALQICKENLTDIQRYKRQTFTVLSLMDLYNETIFRPAIIAQIGPLLAALLQLGYAPLVKPTDTNENNGTFRMTTELYEKLKKDQEKFVSLLHWLLNLCPMSTSMKDFMIILGIKGAPKWLQRETRRHLVEQIMQPNGVIAIIAAVCEDTLDLGEHWNKLDTVSRLIATSHGKNPDEYYGAVCPQILDLIASKHLNHSSTIANCCITALYNYNPDVCVKNIVEKMCSPLLVHSEEGQDRIISENEVEECVENLMKCFIITEAKFKHLPSRVLTRIVIPLFCIYNDTRLSVCILKSKIKQLLLRFLNEEPQKNQLFAEILGHKSTQHFGHHVISKFGPTGGIEIIRTDETLTYEPFADTLLDLTSTSNQISAALFLYLLQFLSELMKLDNENGTETLLETENDAIEKIQKQLLSVKLLLSLSNMSAVQEAQIENPETIVSFMKSLFIEYIKERQILPEKDDCEILYVSLMLIKMILSERKKPLNSPVFNEFKLFLKDRCTVPNIPTQLLLLMKEIIELVENQGESEWKRYQDLSLERKTTKKFEDALRDLTDPILPVRAHGLIVLTKLIETGDPCATARKTIVLQIFQENLKHEDSFIYLAAINGLCALATSCPQVVIETLVHEYIDMPRRISTNEITVETRTKLGEILVKVTRGLGEMATAYKNILVNGFLCATRDSDSLVRASSLSCLGELCKVLGYRLGDIVIEVIYCIGCIIKTDKVLECRRAAVMVSTLLLRGLGKDTLTSLGKDLVDLYRGLKHLRDNEEDPVLRLHAQLSLEELDEIVRDYLFSPPKLEKRIFLLGGS